MGDTRATRTAASIVACKRAIDSPFLASFPLASLAPLRKGEKIANKVNRVESNPVVLAIKREESGSAMEGGGDGGARDRRRHR